MGNMGGRVLQVDTFTAERYSPHWMYWVGWREDQAMRAADPAGAREVDPLRVRVAPRHLEPVADRKHQTPSNID